MVLEYFAEAFGLYTGIWYELGMTYYASYAQFQLMENQIVHGA